MSKKRVFGKPLENDVPQILTDLIGVLDSKALTEQGMFRIQPSEKEMTAVMKKIDSGKKVDFSSLDIHAVATLLKRYVRELPEPLLTYEFYDMFLATSSINENAAREIQVKKLLQFLPAVNFAVIRALCAFFFRLQKNSEANMMTPRNIAICFSQNVLRPESSGGGSKKDKLMVLEDQPYSEVLLEFIIEHYQQLFDDSGEIMSVDKASKMESALSSWMGDSFSTNEKPEEEKKKKLKNKKTAPKPGARGGQRASWNLSLLTKSQNEIIRKEIDEPHSAEAPDFRSSPSPSPTPSTPSIPSTPQTSSPPRAPGPPVPAPRPAAAAPSAVPAPSAPPLPPAPQGPPPSALPPRSGPVAAGPPPPVAALPPPLVLTEEQRQALQRGNSSPVVE